MKTLTQYYWDTIDECVPHATILAGGQPHIGIVSDQRSEDGSRPLVIHNIEVEHRWARRKYPWAAARMAYLPNGCPAELAEGWIEPAGSALGRLNIRAVGSSGSEGIGNPNALSVKIRPL